MIDNNNYYHIIRWSRPLGQPQKPIRQTMMELFMEGMDVEIAPDKD